jgi:hypothetical protein
VETTETSLADRFSACREAASYHSAGLDFVYDKFKEMKNPREIFLNISNKERLTLIGSISEKFVSQSRVASRLSAIDTRVDLLAVEKITSPSVKSSESPVFSSSIIKICNYFDKVINGISILSEVQYAIVQGVQSQEFASFSTDEQNTLLLMFAIYEDSSTYWAEDLGNWEILLNDDIAVKSNNVTTPAEEEVIMEISFWRKVLAIAHQDAIGGLVGAVTGGIYGAMTGAGVGTAAAVVGAAPGALGGAAAGAVAGGISGAVGYSVEAVLTSCSVIESVDPQLSSIEILEQILFDNIDERI